MSVKNIIDAALHKARSTAGGTEKVASGKTDEGSLIKEAHQIADALEYMAGAVVDDGTPSGAAQRRVVEEFFKGADTKSIKGPAESVSPTGVQATPPQAGAKKILPTGQAGGTHPAESVAPTGTQATIGQPPGGEKKADKPLTLLDMLTKQAMDMGPSNEPKNSEALQDAADPGSRNENRNVGRALGSNEGPVNLTKCDAKAPTRDRLKALFASATDTGPSSAAAKAAFPNAYAKGGMKVAEAECEKCGKEPCECKAAEKKAAGMLDLDKTQQSVARHAAIGSAIPVLPGTGPALAANAASDGRGLRAALGSMGGYIGGATLGSTLGALGSGGNPLVTGASGYLGGVAGSGLGAALAHGKDPHLAAAEQQAAEEAAAAHGKTAYATLFDKAGAEKKATTPDVDPRDAIDQRELDAQRAASQHANSGFTTGLHAGVGAGRGFLGGAAGGMMGGASIGVPFGMLTGGAMGLGEGASSWKHRLLNTGIGAAAGGLAGAAGGAALGVIPGAIAGGVSGGIRGHQGGVQNVAAQLAAQREAEELEAQEAAAAHGKTASSVLSAYATLFDKAAVGELGPEARAFAEYIEQVQV